MPFASWRCPFDISLDYTGYSSDELRAEMDHFDKRIFEDRTMSVRDESDPGVWRYQAVMREMIYRGMSLI
jgi:hypothetical protein